MHTYQRQILTLTPKDQRTIRRAIKDLMPIHHDILEHRVHGSKGLALLPALMKGAQCDDMLIARTRKALVGLPEVHEAGQVTHGHLTSHINITKGA